MTNALPAPITSRTAPSVRDLVNDQRAKAPITRRTIWYACTIVIVFFGFLGGLAATAPLDSSSIASGVLTVEGKKQDIQHLEGGTIETIHVRDADVVRIGDPLITLDRAKSEMVRDILSARLRDGRAQAARLRAERGELPYVSFDFSDEELATEDVLQTLAGEQNVFDARQEALAAQSDILKKRIEQMGSELQGLRDQIKAFERQKRLIGEEISAVAGLVEKGLEKNSRLLSLKRGQADIDRQLATTQANIARTEQRIGETRLQITNTKLSFLNEVVAELREVDKENFDLRERLQDADKTLDRTILRAPVAGTVVGLQVFTNGGVISPGQVLMSIVPRDDDLVVEARVNPNDIDNVSAGLPARVRLLAFSQRTVDMVTGTVEHVSADRLVDRDTGQPYYLARIRLDTTEVDPEIQSKLVPGMSAEVMITTGEHTILQYLTKPIRTSLSRALIED